MSHEAGKILLLANYSEEMQVVPRNDRGAHTETRRDLERTAHDAGHELVELEGLGPGVSRALPPMARQVTSTRTPSLFSGM